MSAIRKSRARLPERASAPYVVALDVGSSSVRALVFDKLGHEIKGIGVQSRTKLSITPDGGAEVDADRLADLAIQALEGVEQQMQERKMMPAAVACCTFWHNVVGVGKDGRPTTPVLHPFDTRARQAAEKLKKIIDDAAQHARTGCVLHASYLPAKLLWLSKQNPVAFRATRKWMSFGEYLFLKLFGEAIGSISMVSGSGLWNQDANLYDEEILQALPIDRCQLCSPEMMDQPQSRLRAAWKVRLPLLEALPWYPALGDGACNNIGSGCQTPDRFALMVGTSGALRAVSETASLEIPEGLWCYRVDRRRPILGGALSNGGEVYSWMKRTLALPSEIERPLALMSPGSHGLTILPFLAGERSPHWRAEARAVIAGLGAATRPIEILRAALEGVALRFRILYDLLSARLGVPLEVIASGGALLRSPAWTQMIADSLGRPVIASLEKEPSSRGAALIAFERLGIIGNAREVAVRMGPTFQPIPAHSDVYQEQLRQQETLYAKMYDQRSPSRLE